MALDATNVETITPEFQCLDQAETAERTFREQGVDALSYFLVQHCDPLYNITPVIRFRCPPNVDYVHRCNESFSETNSSLLCDLYSHPVKSSSSSLVYKNPHCAACNGMLEIQDLLCYDDLDPGRGGAHLEMGRLLPSFSRLLDFKSGVSGVSFHHKRICPVGSYHNLDTDKCVTEVGDLGFVAVDDACVQVNVSVTPLLAESSLALVFLLETDMEGTEAEEIILRLSDVVSDAVPKDAWVNFEIVSRFGKVWSTFRNVALLMITLLALLYSTSLAALLVPYNMKSWRRWVVLQQNL